MATSNWINGTDITVYVDDNDNGTLIPVAGATSGSLSLSHSTRDVSNKGSGGWMERLEGQREWSLSVDALYAFDQGWNAEEIYDLIEDRGRVTVAFSTEETSDTFFRGQAIASSLDIEAPNEDNATISCEFQGSGKLYKVTQT